MATLYANHINGTLSSGIGTGDTSLSAAVFADLPEVVAPDIMWLVVDPDGDENGPEIVKVTAHTASATTVTVTRAQQSTTAVSASSGRKVTGPLTKSDADGFLTSDDTDALPLGVVAYTVVTSNASISADSDVTGVTATWTASSDRLYRTSVYLLLEPATGYTIDVKITDSSNSQKQYGVFAADYTGSADEISVSMSVLESGLSGSVTRKARLGTVAGGDLKTVASPAYILVEDLGEA